MKITVTHDDGPVASLSALAELVQRAEQLVLAATPALANEHHTGAATIKVNITPSRKVRNIEVTW